MAMRNLARGPARSAGSPRRAGRRAWRDDHDDPPPFLPAAAGVPGRPIFVDARARPPRSPTPHVMAGTAQRDMALRKST